ncbi:MAG: DNA-binding protein [Candidatus Margulisiibacteriota bacterium]
MKRCLSFAFCVLSFAFICYLSFPAQARVVSGNDLVEDAQFYDGARIEYVGEVIGDLMARGEYVWLNVNDGSRAIGIWAPKKLVGNIKTKGDYNHIGDKIKVVGVFHRACPEHGGDLDIHAEKIFVLEEGSKIEHPINPAKAVLTFLLLLVVLGVVFLPKFFRS